MQIILLFQEFADCFPDADFAGSVRIMGRIVFDRLNGGLLDVSGISKSGSPIVIGMQSSTLRKIHQIRGSAKV